MTFTCGAGAHYNILYGLSRPRSWSTPPPVDRQGLTWRLSEWDARPNRAPGAAQLPPVDLLAKAIAVDAAAALCTRGLVRVDLVLDDDDQPQVLEVNTVPGMTDHSLVPMAAKQAGMNFEQLVLRVLHSSLAGEADANGR